MRFFGRFRFDRVVLAAFWRGGDCNGLRQRLRERDARFLGRGVFRLRFVGGPLVLLRLSVSYRDSIIIRMNLAEGQKSMPVPTVIDKRCLQRGLDAGDLGEIDI